jgi:hypothetical protein
LLAHGADALLNARRRGDMAVVNLREQDPDLDPGYGLSSQPLANNLKAG